MAITPINKTFSYTYDPGTTSLSAPLGGVQSIILNRFESLLTAFNLLELPLVINSSGPYIDSLNSSSYFSYTDKLDGGQQFRVYATPILRKTTVVYPVDPANTNYQFDFSYSFRCQPILREC